MKKVLFNTLISLAFVYAMSANAQERDKKYTERFNVSPNVTIDVNTRYTNIEIETWNKNEVVIEAYMVVEGEVDQQTKDDYFKRWNFEALGNKNNVKVTSKTSNFIDINSFDFDTPDYDDIHLFGDIKHDMPDDFQFIMPEFSVYSLGVLDSLDIDFPELVMSPMPPISPLEPMIFDFENGQHSIFTIEKFDFKKYKKDKNYLKEWKERNREALKDYDVKIGRNFISISTNRDAVSKEELKKRQERFEKQRKEHKKELEQRREERRRELEKRKEEFRKHISERKKEQKKALLERKEALKEQREVYAKRRAEIRDILEKREKVKIKRIIKIKAPKNAKFNMNVKYGSMSFPN